jgi:hypothetical protein
MAWILPFAAVGFIAAAAAFLPPRLWPEEPRASGTVRIVGAGALAAVAAVPAGVYLYGVSISAGLCGDGRSWPPILAAALPLVVVGSWGLRGRNRILVAWPAAVLAAAACISIAEYLDPNAHGHCETEAPYSLNVRPSVLTYSARLSTNSVLPRLNVT